jgi:hypothetical protein
MCHVRHDQGCTKRKNGTAWKFPNFGEENQQVPARQWIDYLSRGSYSSQNELLVDSVRLLGRRVALRDAIHAGVRQLNSGDFTDYQPYHFASDRIHVVRILHGAETLST